MHNYENALAISNILDVAHTMKQYCIRDTEVLMRAVLRLREHAMDYYGVDITNYLSMASMARGVWLRGEAVPKEKQLVCKEARALVCTGRASRDMQTQLQDMGVITTGSG